MTLKLDGLTVRQQRYMKFKKFNWPKVMELADKSKIRLVTYCTLDPDEPDPERQDRLTMSPAFLIALVLLGIDIRESYYKTLDALFRCSDPYVTKKLIAHHKELMWEAWKTAPPEIKNQETDFARRQRFKLKRLADIQPRVAISQRVEDISINGDEYARGVDGKVLTFPDDDSAKCYLRLIGYTADEIEESIYDNLITIGAYL